METIKNFIQFGPHVVFITIFFGVLFSIYVFKWYLERKDKKK